MPNRVRQYVRRAGMANAKLLCLLLTVSPWSFAQFPAAGPSAETCEDTLEAAILPIEPIALPQPEPVEKRLFGVIPNYRADQMQAVYQPITTAQKFHIARQDSFDWPNYFLLVGFTLQSQVAAGGFSHNGGVEGFAQYYARAVADQIIGSYVTEAIFPSLLHEDPRYFRLGTGPIFHRATYAVTRIFVTRLDNGKPRLNLSELAGNAVVVAIATSYYPESRSASGAATRYGLNLGNDAVSNLLTEFWPDIKHRLFHRHPDSSPISAEVLGAPAAGH